MGARRSPGLYLEGEGFIIMCYYVNFIHAGILSNDFSISFHNCRDLHDIATLSLSYYENMYPF